MSETIVVGVDHSPASQLALQRALALAQAAFIHVVHSVDPRQPAGSEDPSQPAKTIADYHHELAEWVAHTVGHQPAVQLHVLFGGPPQDDLCDMASKIGADLLIVGAHGQRGFSRMWLGSCATNVVRNAPCSVLVVRPKNIDHPSTSPSPAGSR